MELEKIKKILFKYWKLLIIIVLLLVLLIAGIYLYFKFNIKEEIKDDVILEKTEVKNEPKKEVIEKITIDIKGAVKNPGVYEIELGKRVNDAIKLAGGLKSSADNSIINLSKKLKDEMVIIIYTKEEIKKMMEGDTVIKIIEKECVCPKLENDACIDEKVTNEKTKVNVDESKKELISINTATINELTSISGIGESKAKSIIEYREKNGNFEKIDDLKNVNGIGESLFEKIKDYITV